MTGAPPSPDRRPGAGEAGARDDDLAATVDRLVALVREQERQIAALQAMIETLL